MIKSMTVWKREKATDCIGRHAGANQMISYNIEGCIAEEGIYTVEINKFKVTES